MRDACLPGEAMQSDLCQHLSVISGERSCKRQGPGQLHPSGPLSCWPSGSQMDAAIGRLHQLGRPGPGSFLSLSSLPSMSLVLPEPAPAGTAAGSSWQPPLLLCQRLCSVPAELWPHHSLALRAAMAPALSGPSLTSLLETWAQARAAFPAGLAVPCL